MPTYDFVDTRTGQLVERTVALAQLDALPAHLQRITVNAVGIQRGTPDPNTPEVAVPRALKQIEQTIPADAIARGMQRSVTGIKKVWAI